jgi:nucleotide-binding universal stress UspA family protein
MKILLATDGSQCSRAAVKKACQIINDPSHTDIKVVSAFEDAYPIAAEPVVLSSEFYQHMIDESKGQAEHFVEETAELIRKHFKDARIHVSTDVLRGAPEQQIIDEARLWNADLIVVGSHGRGFWGRMLGSVSDAVIHHAPCSVLVVRQAADVADDEPENEQRELEVPASC